MGIRGFVAASLLTVLAFGQAQAREAPLTNEERTVVQVYEAPGRTADQVYAAARTWVASLAPDAVVEYESRQDGVIVVRGTIPYPCEGGINCRIRAKSWRVGYAMHVETKDGKFRLTFDAITMKYPDVVYHGVIPGYDEPISSRTDMDMVRGKLLELGPKLVASLQQGDAAQSW